MSPTVASAMAIRPPPPSPWTSRAAISWSMFCEKPEASDPATNTTIAIWNSSRRPYRSEIFPHSGVDAVEASR